MDFQIDRSCLRKYQNSLGKNILYISFVTSVLFGFFVIFFLMYNPKTKASFLESVSLGFWTFSGVLLVLSLLSVLYYYFTIGRFAKVYAESFSVMVSGSFLRIIEQKKIYSDRKIHFNQLTWYSIIQDSFMKSAGIKALVIGTKNPHLQILILGLESVEEVRDFLVDYDCRHKHLA